MSDRRESAQVHPTASPNPSRRFARLIPAPTERRLAVGRLALTSLAILAAVLLGSAAGTRAWQSALTWLHARPAYQLPFVDIELEAAAPPGANTTVPAWVRAGAPGILEQVRNRANYPETLSAPAVDLAALAAAFAAESPWVRSVRHAECRARNRLKIAIEFRKPVAFVRMGVKPRSSVLYLDQDGVVLPADDLDLDAAGPLIELIILPPPDANPKSRPVEITPVAAETRPGRRLRFSAVESVAATEPVLAAARLAAFLNHSGAAAGPPHAPCRIVSILCRDGGISLQTAENAVIFWTRPARPDRPDTTDNPKKWDWLRAWLERNRLADYPGNQFYLAFDHEQLAPVRR